MVLTNVSRRRKLLGSRAGSMPYARITLLGLAVIVGGTLFPYNFSSNNFVSLTNSFGPANEIGRRGKDLLIGVDGELLQPFKGSVRDILIYKRTLAAAEIQAATINVHPDIADLAASYPLDADEGTIIRDTSGNVNHGVLVSDVNRIEKGPGGGLRFNGPDEYVKVRNSPSIDIAGTSFSILMWVNLKNSTDGMDKAIVAKPWRPHSMQYPFYQYGVEFATNGTLNFYFGDNTGRLRGAFRMRPHIGIWTHVAFTYDGRRVRGYIDGREQLAAAIEGWHLRDILVNLLLFLPFGFGVAGMVRERGAAHLQAILFALASGCLLSMGVETAQCWLPTRDPSLLDVATNTISAAIGGVWSAKRMRIEK